MSSRRANSWLLLRTRRELTWHVEQQWTDVFAVLYFPSCKLSQGHPPQSAEAKFILRERFEGAENRPRLRGRNSQLKIGVKATVFWQAMTVVGAKNDMH